MLQISKIFIVLLILCRSISADEISVIVNTQNHQKSIYRYELQSIFLLNSMYWDNGDSIVPIFLNFDSIQHKHFITNFLNINTATFTNTINMKINRGDSKGYFIVNNEQLALQKVKEIKGAITYIGGYLMVNGGDNENIRIIRIID